MFQACAVQRVVGSLLHARVHAHSNALLWACQGRWRLEPEGSGAHLGWGFWAFRDPLVTISDFYVVVSFGELTQSTFPENQGYFVGTLRGGGVDFIVQLCGKAELQNITFTGKHSGLIQCYKWQNGLLSHRMRRRNGVFIQRSHLWGRNIWVTGDNKLSPHLWNWCLLA